MPLGKPVHRPENQASYTYCIGKNSTIYQLQDSAATNAVIYGIEFSSYIILLQTEGRQCQT